MKSLALCIVLVGLSLAMISCAFQNKTASPSAVSAQKTDVSHLFGDDLNFTKDFVQSLSDAGWTIQEVHHSKFNGFFGDSRKAAFIKTSKGVVEAVFFQSKAEVEQIRVREEQTGVSGYHRYIIEKLPMTNQRIEGGVCYFTKYRNLFIITTERELIAALDQLPA